MSRRRRDPVFWKLLYPATPWDGTRWRSIVRFIGPMFAPVRLLSVGLPGRRRLSTLLDKFCQRNARHGACIRDNSRFGARGNGVGIGAHVSLKKQNISLKLLVDFFGGAEAVVEAKLARIALPRRTAPAACLLP